MPQNPHDKLFKSTFSKIEHARGFLRAVLPKEISAKVAWDKLRFKSGSFVNEQFREVFSDLLFETCIGDKECLLYILAEHKSEQSPWVMLQLLQYQVAIWNRWREEHPKEKRLPPIVPLVVYHGKTKWKVSKQFSDLFLMDNSIKVDLQRYLPSFECEVQDLTQKEVIDLKQWSELSEFARLVLFLLKSVRDSTNILEDLEGWKEILREIERLPQARNRFTLVFSYMFEAKKIDTQEEKMLLDFVNREIGSEAKEGLMTGADRLRAEGEARGIKKGEARGIRKGEARGKAKTVQNLLKLKFGALSKADKDKVMSANEAKLDRMTELVLTDTTLRDILDC